MFALSGATPPASLEDLASGLTAMERGIALDRALGLTSGASVLPAFFRAIFHNASSGGAQSGDRELHHPPLDKNRS